MRWTRLTAALVPGLAAASLLAACGAQTRTVTVSGAPAVTQATAASTPTTATPATTQTSTAAAPATAAGGTSAPSTTRSAPEPAFTEHQVGAEGVEAAAAVRAHGYTPENTSEYHPTQALRVLVGTRTGSTDGYDQQVFFFVNGRYIGTDAKEPSASVKVVSQNDTEVTLAYPLYRHGDPLCCPGGGQATVHFQLNNGHLTALGTIPPASSTGGLSRN